MTSTIPHVELVDIGKRFSGVQALQGITLAIERGTVHGLVGENGAGKSTLGRIIAGAHTPDTGTMRVDGTEVSYRAPRDALARRRDDDRAGAHARAPAERARERLPGQ